MLDLFSPQTDTTKSAADDRAAGANDGLTVQTCRADAFFHTRVMTSQKALDDTLPWHFEEGAAYHCFSFGDVDSLSYLRAILKQQKLKYLIVSSWAISARHAKQISDWCDEKIIGRLDLYVSQLFKTVYAESYSLLCQSAICGGGRIAICKNHSKVMVGFGERFDFAVVSSANMNYNPRAECTVISVDRRLARFYKADVFDKIKSEYNDFDHWKPFILDEYEAV